MISGSALAHIFSSSSTELKKECDEDNEQSTNEDKYGIFECYISDIKREAEQPDDNYLHDIKEEREVDFAEDKTNSHTFKNIDYDNNEIKEEMPEVTIKCVLTEGEYSCK